jgi:hypothetical protein
MNKPQIVAAILEKLREEFDARRAASKSTRVAGNDPESKAENKYDTLSIEQNYLADGLAKQAQVAAQAAAAYEKLTLHDFAPDEPIDLGALVEIQFPGETEWFFLGPAAGGIEVVHEGRPLIVITPESPLGSQLLDRKAGDALENPRAIIHAVR